MRLSSCIETITSSVTAWSTARIPFEPKDWLLEFRNQLKLAIARLSPVDGRTLYAEFGSPISKCVDVENLLIYYIGPTQLSNVTTRGLVFKRSYQVSRDCPVHLSSPALHQYECLLIDVKSPSFEGQDGRLLASLSFELTASALHCHDGSNIDYVSRQLGKNLGLSDDALIGTLLEDSSYALFGRTNPLYPYRNNVKWNPQDDYCTYCSMKSLYGLPLRNLKIDCHICDFSQHDTI
jgi:hypothetical protein